MVHILFPESKIFLRTLLSEPRIVSYFKPLRSHHSETYAHSLRVGLLSLDMGYEQSFDKEVLQILGYSALLHDAGKLSVPKALLHKKGSFTNQEQTLMQSHTRMGFLEVSDVHYETVREIVVSHHEYKKNPYPRTGKDRRAEQRGDDRRRMCSDTKNLTQIVAVCDMFDALSRKRSYKNPLSLVEVKTILQTQFIGNQEYVEKIIQRG